MALRILVIEDEFLVALEIMAVLKKAGFLTIEHVDSESLARKKILEEHWDGVIADANLNGQTIERVAALLQERSIPLLVVTGYDRNTLPASLAGVPIMEKPFDGPLLARNFVGLLWKSAS